MTKLKKKILKWGPIANLIEFTRHVKFPGKYDLSLHEIGWFFFRELQNNKIFDRCAAVTYNFVMAIPPTLLVLFSLIPYLPLEGVQETILETLHLIAQNEKMYNTMSGIVNDFMGNERGEVLSFGIFLTLFFSSNGIMGLIRGFERRHLSVYIHRTGLHKRWTAIKLTVMLLFVALLSIVVLIIQTQIVDEILLIMFNNVLIVRILSILVVTAIIFTYIGVIYRYGPSLKHRVKFFSPGAFIATFLSVVTSVVFFFLVNNFIHYNKVYGSVGTLMAFMVWIWLNTLVILIGYDLNVSLILVKDKRLQDGAGKDDEE